MFKVQMFCFWLEDGGWNTTLTTEDELEAAREAQYLYGTICEWNGWEDDCVRVMKDGKIYC